MKRTALEAALIESIEALDKLHKDKHRTPSGVNVSCASWRLCPLFETQRLVDTALEAIVRNDRAAGISTAVRP